MKTIGNIQDYLSHNWNNQKELVLGGSRTNPKNTTFWNAVLNPTDPKYPGVGLVGCIEQDNPEWTEYRIIWSISKETNGNPGYLSEALRWIGAEIKKLEPVKGLESVGIQEVLVSEPDNYYVSVYALEEI